MCASLVHRGPDDEGSFVGPEIALGMRRLSIIDVEGGHQPIYNEDRSVVVVFNGEIYNYRNLRATLEGRGHTFRTQSDTEVIVHAYEDAGDDCVARFNGIFAFALWDLRAKRLLLARDRMGVKPLYYTRTGDGLAFASEIKALLTLPGVDRMLDLTATAEFLRLGFVPAPATMFQAVRKLPAAHTLVADREGVRTAPYWDLRFSQHDGPGSLAGTFEECRDELRSVLANAVRGQMVSDVPLGAFLSGGVDSSTVVALMTQSTPEVVRTFSVGFDARYGYHNEAPAAEAVARHLGTKHETLIVKPRVLELLPELVEKLDEPLTDTSFLVTYLVSSLAREHVTVALSGIGGDELFGGYRRYLAPQLRAMTAWLPRGVHKLVRHQVERWVPADRGSRLGNLGRYAKALVRTMNLPLAAQYVDLISPLSAEHVASLLRLDGTGVEPAERMIDLFDHTDAPTDIDRLLYVDTKTLLPESLLLLTDKMGMAASLEVRVPFLDNQVIDFVRRVPARYRVGRFALKRLLKAAAAGVVPDFVLTRPKRGFGTPMGTWLREDLRPLVEDLLHPDRLRRQGLFEVPVVNGLLAAHAAGREDHTEAIFSLLTFEVWLDRFGVRLP
jgi:asparagine synthase (glutamine-hydrolysing)